MGDPWQDFDCSCHCSEHAQIMNATPPKRKHMYAPTFFFFLLYTGGLLSFIWWETTFLLSLSYLSFCVSLFIFFIIFNRIFFISMFVCFYWSYPMLSIFFFSDPIFSFFFFFFTLHLFFPLFLLHVGFSFMLAFYYLSFSLYPSVFLSFFIPLVTSFIVQDFYSFYILLFFYSFSEI